MLYLLSSIFFSSYIKYNIYKYLKLFILDNSEKTKINAI